MPSPTASPPSHHHSPRLPSRAESKISTAASDNRNLSQSAPRASNHPPPPRLIMPLTPSSQETPSCLVRAPRRFIVSTSVAR
ncbi:hypothetical protein K458DRAFT_422903, partial [Lentithecium fluviatile CBS 122367]